MVVGGRTGLVGTVPCCSLRVDYCVHLVNRFVGIDEAVQSMTERVALTMSDSVQLCVRYVVWVS